MLDRHLGAAVREAARRLPADVRRRVDAEDVAQSAAASFARAVSEGRFDGADGGSRALLMTILRRKAGRTVERERAAKRDARREAGHAAALPDRGGDAAAELADLWTLLDPTERRIAAGLAEGRTLGEIAASLGCHGRTIRRRLADLRSRLSEPEGDAAKLSVRTTLTDVDVRLHRLVGTGASAKVYAATACGTARTSRRRFSASRCGGTRPPCGGW